MNNVPENDGGGLPGDAEVASRARAIFRSACEGTDSYHALRLGLARRRALDARARRARAVPVWAPVAGATACCVLVAGLLWLHPGTLTPPDSSHAPATAAVGEPDTDAAMPEIGSTQMELVENLDFYRWLASQPAVATARAGGRR